MKKNVLSNIEKIKKERNISKEVEKTIIETIIANWAIAISFIILIIAFMVSANFLSKNGAILVYNISTMIFLANSLTVIEIAYKKDSGALALMAIELLVISVFTLFSPHIFIRTNYTLIYGFIATVCAYYTIKIIRIYFLEKKKYLNDISDITDIIKKESKDELAQQEIEKRKVEQQKNKQTAKKTRTKKATTKKTEKNTETKKNTRTKKTTTTPKKKTTNTKTKNETATKKTSTTPKNETKSKKSSTTTKKTVNKENK